VAQAVVQALEKKGRVDVLTLSGSGEPTLDRHMGETIRLLKRLLDLPVAVITNGSLLYRRDVREEILAADLVLPSLDGWTEAMFQRINRPHPSLRLEAILEGLVALRKEFKGEIWLEVLLVHGINDDPADMPGLLEWLERIRPDRVQLNTVTRPPAEPWVKAPSLQRMGELKRFLGAGAEIVASFRGLSERASLSDLEERVAETVMRRPLSAEDLGSLFGLDLARARELLEGMASRHQWRAENIQGRIYYRNQGSRPEPEEPSP